jgi:hypothetical protein
VLAKADATILAKDTYKFDGNLLVVQKIGSFENDAERALSNLLSNAVVDADHIGGGRHGLRRKTAQIVLLQSDDG